MYVCGYISMSHIGIIKTYFVNNHSILHIYILLTHCTKHPIYIFEKITFQVHKDKAFQFIFQSTIIKGNKNEFGQQENGHI